MKALTPTANPFTEVPEALPMARKHDARVSDVAVKAMAVVAVEWNRPSPR